MSANQMKQQNGSRESQKFATNENPLQQHQQPQQQPQHEQQQQQTSQPNVRHIPIFVEGRDEPVCNKNFDSKSNGNSMKTPPPNDLPKPTSIFNRFSTMRMPDMNIKKSTSTQRCESPNRGVPLNVQRTNSMHKANGGGGGGGGATNGGGLGNNGTGTGNIKNEYFQQYDSPQSTTSTPTQQQQPPQQQQPTHQRQFNQQTSSQTEAQPKPQQQPSQQHHHYQPNQYQQQQQQQQQQPQRKPSPSPTSSQQQYQPKPFPINIEQDEVDSPSNIIEPPESFTTKQDNSIDKIQNIQKDVLELMDNVERFIGSHKDKQYMYLDEMLTQNLLKLDTIDAEGKENIKQARREAIKCINTCISVLEAKADAGDNLNSSTQ